MVNLKWVVTPASTGTHRAFAFRSWPHAEYKDSGDWAARLDAEDGRSYQSGDNKKADLGFNLVVYIMRDGEWRRLKQRVRSLAQAKELVKQYYNAPAEQK